MLPLLCCQRPFYHSQTKQVRNGWIHRQLWPSDDPDTESSRQNWRTSSLRNKFINTTRIWASGTCTNFNRQKQPSSSILLFRKFVASCLHHIGNPVDGSQHIVQDFHLKMVVEEKKSKLKIIFWSPLTFVTSLMMKTSSPEELKILNLNKIQNSAFLCHVLLRWNYQSF